MNIIKLAFMRIRDDFLNQRLLMTLYVLGTTICIFVFSVFWSSIPEMISQYDKLTEYKRTYTIFLKSEETVNSDDLNFLKEDDISKITACDFSLKKYDLLEKNKSFSGIYSIDIVFSHELSDEESAEFLKKINDDFAYKHEISDIGTPENAPEFGSNSSQLGELVTKFLNISLTYVICFIACAYLFKYVFDINTYENTVYSIVGAAKSSVLRIALTEALVLVFGCSLVSVGLNLILKDNVLKEIYGLSTAYSVWDYILIICFTVILSLAVMVPFFIKYLKNPIIKTKIDL